MIKKVFVGVIIAVAFSLLILGAVNRTLAKADGQNALNLNQNLSEANGNGNGTGRRNQDANNIASNLYNSGNDRNLSQQNNSGSGNGNGGASDGNGQGNQPEGATLDGTGIGLAEVGEWLTETGVVESVSADEWIITLSDGTSLVVEGRTLSYLEDLGFTVNPNDVVTLTGFLEDGDFEIGQIMDDTTGETAAVRDVNGRPLWAGRR